jgi:C4-dicarboxylate-specific signal transduction histidine kinase
MPRRSDNHQMALLTAIEWSSRSWFVAHTHPQELSSPVAADGSVDIAPVRSAPASLSGTLQADLEDSLAALRRFADSAPDTCAHKRDLLGAEQAGVDGRDLEAMRLYEQATPLEHLDLATVIRMSQALAGELVLDRLIETLMTITIEHAGADRGLLVLPRQDNLRVEAEARNTAETVVVRLVSQDEPPPDLPASILAQVRRTLQPVILDDARAKTPFSADRYLRLNRARSVLCLPLVKQGELIGLLYLENSLASQVFTPARIAVLKLLSSQIAISLENARLYADLVSENRERQKAEEALRGAQAELTRVTRLTTIGELVASIAHEINQPLTAATVQGRAGLNWLSRDVPNLEEARRALESIGRDINRAGDVIRSLRAMVTKSGPQRAWFDINDVADEVLALARTELHKHGVAIRTALSAETPRIYGDRVQLMQVMLNLVMNGIEAMNAMDGSRDMMITSEATSNGDVRVSVADTGFGVDGATAERVFDSFFTTKATGMGMGLSICRSIISAHGGRLWFEPNAPHGTIFQFELPVGAQMASSPE